MQGRDSVKFLQGFTTNNITELVPGAAQVNAIRHAKNTVLTLELVSRSTRRCSMHKVGSCSTAFWYAIHPTTNRSTGVIGAHFVHD